MDLRIFSGSGVVQIRPFTSFCTMTITNNNIVTVCSQGFNCDHANVNAQDGLEQCIVALLGKFGKINNELETK